jgi:hypothetical protein
MIADFLLEFRFEFLWPFWLVIRSLNDSFKYQGIVINYVFFFITFFFYIINLKFIFNRYFHFFSH